MNMHKFNLDSSVYRNFLKVYFDLIEEIKGVGKRFGPLFSFLLRKCHVDSNFGPEMLVKGLLSVFIHLDPILTDVVKFCS